MKVHKVGVMVEYKNANGTGEKIMADIHRCDSCGWEVITAFASRALAQHFDEGYAKVKADIIVPEVTVV